MRDEPAPRQAVPPPRRARRAPPSGSAAAGRRRTASRRLDAGLRQPDRYGGSAWGRRRGYRADRRQCLASEVATLAPRPAGPPSCRGVAAGVGAPRCGQSSGSPARLARRPCRPRRRRAATARATRRTRRGRRAGHLGGRSPPRSPSGCAARHGGGARVGASGRSLRRLVADQGYPSPVRPIPCGKARGDRHAPQPGQRLCSRRSRRFQAHVGDARGADRRLRMVLLVSGSAARGQTRRKVNRQPGRLFSRLRSGD